MAGQRITAFLYVKPRASHARLNIWPVRNYFFIREIKIHAYGKRQTADWSWEFVKLENKQIKLSRAILTDKTGVKLLIFQ